MSLNDMIARRQTRDETFNINPSWSPDGRKISFTTIRNGKSKKYWIEVDKQPPFLISPSVDFDDKNPAWSPDDNWIAFESNRTSSSSEIYTVASDGSNLTNLTFHSGDDIDPDWSPDG